MSSLLLAGCWLALILPESCAQTVAGASRLAAKASVRKTCLVFTSRVQQEQCHAGNLATVCRFVRVRRCSSVPCRLGGAGLPRLLACTVLFRSTGVVRSAEYHR